jgi:UDP-glucuronate decarboxylase
MTIQRILVTGGAGFIGSHLCERLVNEGHDVVCVDNFFTSQKSNVQHLMRHTNFELIRHDVTLPLYLEVDQIYNLACPAAPGHYQYNPIKTMKTSFLGTMHMLGLAKRCKARMVQASTSEIYGEPQEHPQRESYRGNVNPIGPRACYDEGKRAAETLCVDYYRMHQTDVRIARIFNTYGPKMHPYDGRVVANFLRQAITGEPLTIYGDGSQTRSFCYVEDMVAGLIRLMRAEDMTPLPVNLGNPEEFTICELLLGVFLSLDKTLDEQLIRTLPLPPDDPTRRKPDISRAQALLNWSPMWRLDRGLKQTAQWFKSICFDNYRPPTPNH